MIMEQGLVKQVLFLFFVCWHTESYELKFVILPILAESFWGIDSFNFAV